MTVYFPQEHNFNDCSGYFKWRPSSILRHDFFFFKYFNVMVLKLKFHLLSPTVYVQYNVILLTIMVIYIGKVVSIQDFCDINNHFLYLIF